MKLGLPHHHHEDAAPVNPCQTHTFVEVNDAGIGAMASGAYGGRSGVNVVAVTDNFIRKARCGVQGCGRERHDEIHSAPEG